MELPFAVEASESDRLQQSNASDGSSLVTASSQGSLVPSGSDEPILQPHSSSVPLHQDPSASYRSVPPPALPPEQPTSSPNTTSATSRITSVFSQWGSSHPPVQSIPTETVDLMDYVNVNETDADEVDIILAGGDPGIGGSPASHPHSAIGQEPRKDVLAVLLSGNIQSEDAAGEASLVTVCEQANQAAARAVEAKKEGNLQEALNAHTQAAKLFRQATVHMEKSACVRRSLLLLSQTHAKSALALKRVIKSRPNSFLFTKTDTSKERLRATVRGALDNRTEADISDSAFLGRAVGQQTTTTPSSTTERNLPTRLVETTQPPDSSKAMANPVDEMMELERELRDMDMALSLGNSIASLDARSQNRMKSSVVDGSFMVVPPGSNSYMSSSMWGGGQQQPPSTVSNTPRTPAIKKDAVTGSGRTRPNRVQNILEASSARAVTAPPQAVPSAALPKSQQQGGLESSWWGNSSAASHALSSSVISLASGVGGPIGHEVHGSTQSAANTKQLMRLMDSLKTLGDENAALLREVEDAEAARMEAKAAKEQMRMFKEEYSQRFAALKGALEKFRKGYPDHSKSDLQETNPVASSIFVKAASTSDQLQRQEQLIRKLTADLKKEKEESKKKDAALRKYESFYREVKARSAQKAAQRQKEMQQQQQQKQSRMHHSSRMPS